MTGGAMRVGASLDVVELEMSPQLLVLYGGATWDWHRLHHDNAYAARAGLDAPIVDGQHFGGLFARQALRWGGPPSRVTSMKLRFRDMVAAGETVRVTGTVSSLDGAVAVLDQELRVEDRLCATAVTHVRLPATG